MTGNGQGDVVLAYSPIELNKRICKRLVAEEGEIIRVAMDGSVLQGKTVLVMTSGVWSERTGEMCVGAGRACVAGG